MVAMLPIEIINRIILKVLIFILGSRIKYEDINVSKSWRDINYSNAFQQNCEFSSNQMGLFLKINT